MDSKKPMINPTTLMQDQGGSETEMSLLTRVSSLLQRIRYQLLGGILFCVAAPALLRYNLEVFVDQVSSYNNSLVGTFCALLFGFLILRKVSALPGPGALLRVVPAFVLSYSIVAIFFFFLRLDYSRYQFLMSCGFSVLWFLFVLAMLARLNKPTLALVPGGYASELSKFKFVDWRIVKSPAAADKYYNLPLVLDFKDPKVSVQWERYIAEAAISGREVYNAKQLSESLTGRVQINHLSENVFGHLSPDSIYEPAKRYVDTIGAFFLILFLSPLFLLVAIAIKLTSAGPVIFKQKRIGFRGRQFTVWKFRSMYVAPTGDGTERGSDMTRADDDRITPVGRFIRKTRIDELPQIFNIFRGEMSWIGPRPETLRLSEWYENEIPFYRYRHIVRPGISGWAQVKQGHVTTVSDVRTKLEYDLYYVKHFSIWLDILIVMHTLRVVFTGHGAK